jgi:nitronate monooxygenase
VISLLPEVSDALYECVRFGELSEMPILLAAGGVADGCDVAAALALGTEGVVMGTKYPASEEADILQGYKNDVLRTVDGGQTTVRCSVYDTLRGITDWSEQYGVRGVTNQSYHDALNGIPWEENKRLYAEAVEMGDKGWGGIKGRMTTYARTAVGW